jgi:hypothetical protein
MKLHLLSTLAASAALLQCAVSAGQAIDSSKDGKKAIVSPCPPDDRLLFDLESSYVFESDFKSRRRNAKGDAYNGSVGLGYRIPLGEGWPNTECGTWYLRLGAHYARHDFDHSGGLPLPNHIQTLAGVIALEYVVSNETAILLETRPGVYFEDDIAGRNFDSPTTVGFAFRLSDGFIGVVGATYGAFRTYPILPGIGFKWTISDSLTLTAIFPKATLAYHFSPSCGMYVEGEYVGDAVRVDKVRGRPSRLDHAALQYSEYRAGAGIFFKLGHITGEFGAGYAFQRKFNYHRADRSYETDDGAPFIRAQLTAAF